MHTYDNQLQAYTRKNTKQVLKTENEVLYTTDMAPHLTAAPNSISSAGKSYCSVLKNHLLRRRVVVVGLPHY